MVTVRVAKGSAQSAPMVQVVECRWVIFLTDRREGGRPHRLVPLEKFGQATTTMLHRAVAFPSEAGARRFLKRIELNPRYLYTPLEMTPAEIAKSRPSPRPRKAASQEN